MVFVPYKYSPPLFIHYIRCFYLTKQPWKVSYKISCNVFKESIFVISGVLSVLISILKIPKNHRQSDLGSREARGHWDKAEWRGALSWLFRHNKIASHVDCHAFLCMGILWQPTAMFELLLISRFTLHYWANTETCCSQLTITQEPNTMPVIWLLKVEIMTNAVLPIACH